MQYVRHTRRDTILAALAVLLLVQLFPLTVQAQAMDLSQVMPALRGMPAPSWAREGTRLTYYTRSATVPRTNSGWSVDKDGGWTDGKGNSFSWNLRLGSAAHGYVQADVVSVDDQAAVLDVITWLFHLSTGPLVPTAQTCMTGLPASPQGWWVNPVAFRGLRRQNKLSLKILTGPCTVGGRTYQAIRIQRGIAGVRNFYVYDLRTGILLRSGEATLTDRGRFWTLMISDLVSQRQIRTPWTPTQSRQGWLARGSAVRYQGTRSTHHASYPGRPFTVGVTSDFTVARRFRNAVVLNMLTVTNGGRGYANVKQTIASGPAQLCPMSLPPADLQRLRAGQVIDTDNITKITTTVPYIGRGANGRNIVVIRMATGGCWIDRHYDVESGMAVGSKYTRFETKLAREVTDLRLTQMR